MKALQLFCIQLYSVLHVPHWKDELPLELLSSDISKIIIVCSYYSTLANTGVLLSYVLIELMVGFMWFSSAFQYTRVWIPDPDDVWKAAEIIKDKGGRHGASSQIRRWIGKQKTSPLSFTNKSGMGFNDLLY